MAEHVDLYHNAEGYHRADGVLEELAEWRITSVLWDRYCKALAALKAVEANIERSAQKPIIVTPDQEDAFRRAAKPGAWIVVRTPTAPAVEEGGRPLADDASVVAPEPPPPVPLPAPAGDKPQRPRPGPCERRGGMPHTAYRYLIIDGWSEYDKGRKRVDGLCICGERINDVRCPHQKQQPGVLPPQCAWCHKVLVSGAGNIDNRLPDGRPDPNVRTQVPPGFSAGDENSAIRAAFRAPED